MDVIEAAAQRLRDAQTQGVPCEPVRTLIGDTDIAAAYQVQQINNALRLAEGGVVVGQKIGLTSLAVQKQLGVDQPDFGLLFADTEVKNGGGVRASEILQPKAEAEIAFVMKHDLTGEITLERAKAAIDYAVGAIEIVGSRVLNWDIRITDTVADNASASHFVLGDVRQDVNELDLAAVKMQLKKNGEVVSEGMGAACMGNPLFALVWLAQTFADLGTPLKAGDIVLSGALGPMCAGEAGDTFVAEIDGFGAVAFSFEG
ncbi:MAG: 2-keto-4-pentenoate hydratase [Bacteroidota bacterium]